MKYRVKHVLEYVILRGVTGLLGILPYRLALCVGWVIAGVAHFLFRYRLRTSRERLHSVFGHELPPARIRRLAWLAWRNFVFSCIEMLRRGNMSLEWIQSVVENEDGIERMRQHIASGEGGVLATCHMGSWEMAGTTCQLMGMRFFQIAAKQKNPLVNAWWHQLRNRGKDDETIERGAGTMRKVIRYLRDGRTLAILPDIRASDEGFAIPFLGGVANIGPGMGLFARHGNVPIFPCVCIRHGWTRHTFTAYEPIRPDLSLGKREDAERMTREVMLIMDAAIRKNPEQWFWANKRWILDPPPQHRDEQARQRA